MKTTIVHREPVFKHKPLGKDEHQTRNSLCKCGSGKKYKRCCELKEKQEPIDRRIAWEKKMAAWIEAHKVTEPVMEILPVETNAVEDLSQPSCVDAL